MSVLGTPEPRPRLEIVGGDGNAFVILGKMRQAARSAGWPDERWEKVRQEATSGDYDKLLQTAMKHFDVCGEGEEDFDEDL